MDRVLHGGRVRAVGAAQYVDRTQTCAVHQNGEGQERGHMAGLSGHFCTAWEGAVL